MIIEDKVDYEAFGEPKTDIPKLIAEEVAKRVEESYNKLLNLHARALACHCECLGMNSENSWAVCSDITPPYNQGHYQEVMQKWGLINEKGEPII